ncbi:MAG: metal dependent phosphohydrolase [Gammaproteobacteria bacterium]|nr:MAG: metal dependent phosphohydrolase [Gammaproteobacteria bacterium]TND02447.1 MAG: metal dependent phosphohydrolase [Gammaproteobacteria bacterium]
MFDRQTLEKGLREIPPLPVAVTAVMEVLNRKDVDFGELQKKIAQDPALAARILKVANSPFYGLGGEVSSLKEACVILGIHAVRNIVITAGVIGQFPADGGNHLNLIGLWQHAIGTGVAAKVLAPSTGVDQETAFTAGLLHDIGKMVLDVHFADRYGKVIEYRDANSCLLRDAETAVLGIDHCEIGGMIAHRWKLPEALALAIKGHHTPCSYPSVTLVALVHVADILCRGLELGDGGDTLIPMLAPDAVATLKMDIKNIGTYLSQIEALFGSSKALLG